MERRNKKARVAGIKTDVAFILKKKRREIIPALVRFFSVGRFFLPYKTPHPLEGALDELLNVTQCRAERSRHTKREKEIGFLSGLFREGWGGGEGAAGWRERAGSGRIGQRNGRENSQKAEKGSNEIKWSIQRPTALPVKGAEGVRKRGQHRTIDLILNAVVATDEIDRPSPPSGCATLLDKASFLVRQNPQME